MTAVNLNGLPVVNLEGLSVKPYAVQVFTDLARGKEFTTLFYRRKEASLDTVLAFAQGVVEDARRAGLTLTGPVKVELSPFGENFRCHLAVPVSLAVPVKENNSDAGLVKENNRDKEAG